MVQINFAQRQVNAKIVYYGPGMSGKTTNLEIVHQRAPAPNRGDLTSISTDGDRTLFFDFMPLDLGTVAGMRTCFQIYTVPGQVYYNSTRKLVLQGVDGVVFVADSSTAMLEENLESMRNLEQNLAEYGKNLATIPLIIQYNKRDLPDAMSIDELNRALNPYNAPHYEAIANTGQGVFPTLKALAARVLETIHTGAKTQSAAASAPLSTGQTGYHAGALPQVTGAPAAIPRGLSQTGFHAQPALAQAAPQGPRAIPLHAPAPQQAMPFAAQMPNAPHAPAAMPSIPPPSMPASQPRQPLQRGAPHAGVEALAQTGIHPPPGFAMPPMPMSAPIAPNAPQRAPMQVAPPSYPATPLQPPTATGYYPQVARPQPGNMRNLALPAQDGAPIPGASLGSFGAQAPAQAPGSLQMMRAEKKPRAAASPATAKPRSSPAARAAHAPELVQRSQPRSAPMATPGAGSSRRMLYVSLFVTVALGVGAVVAKLVLKVF